MELTTTQDELAALGFPEYKGPTDQEVMGLCDFLCQGSKRPRIMDDEEEDPKTAFEDAISLRLSCKISGFYFLVSYRVKTKILAVTFASTTYPRKTRKYKEDKTDNENVKAMIDDLAVLANTLHDYVVSRISK